MGYGRKNTDHRVYKAGTMSDGEAAEALTRVYRAGTPRSNRDRLYVLDVSDERRDLKAIRDGVVARCPGMRLAFRNNVKTLWKGPLSDFEEERPKYVWADPLDGTREETYECYEGYSHDGSGDCYPVYTRQCRRREVRPARRSAADRTSLAPAPGFRAPTPSA